MTHQVTMVTYSGMAYVVGEGTREECRDIVRRFLDRRKRKGHTGEVTVLDPNTWECEDSGYFVGDYDGVLKIRKTS